MVCCQGGVIAGRFLADKIRWFWVCLMDQVMIMMMMMMPIFFFKCSV